MRALRPRIELANPIPIAAINGTVTTLVVTPPESKARPTISGGATNVATRTTT